MERERVGVKPGINILPSPAELSGNTKEITPTMRRESNEDWFVHRFEEFMRLPSGGFSNDRKAFNFLYYTCRKHVEYLKDQGYGG